MNKLESFITEQFGTKTLFSERMNVTRTTTYRWLKNPQSMQLSDLKRLSEVSGMSIEQVVSKL